MPDLADFTEAEGARPIALCETAGLTADDIDVAMIYENFSPVVFLPAGGVRVLRPRRGQGLHRRRQHRDRTARLPVNTHGGLLGEAYIHGVNNIIEAVRQLRGTAANQVDGARNALVASGHSGMILSTD